MKHLLLPIALLLALPLASACAQGTAPRLVLTRLPASSLTNRSIIDLTAKGLPADSIIARIAASPGAFDLSASNLQALKQNRVSDAVLRAMAAKADKSSFIASITPTPAEVAMLTVPGCPYVRDAKTKKWLALEQTTCRIVGQMDPKSDLYHPKTLTIIRLQHEKSPTRQLATDSVVVLINTAGQQAPDLVFFQATLVKGNRETISTVHPPAGNGFMLVSDLRSFKTYHLPNGIIRLAYAKKLPPGEYFFMNQPEHTNQLTTYTGPAYGLGID